MIIAVINQNRREAAKLEKVSSSGAGVVSMGFTCNALGQNRTLLFIHRPSVL